MFFEKSKPGRVIWRLLVIITPFLLVNAFFGDIIKCPSCFLFTDIGDGLKNYYTLDYYVKHDTGTRFTGMNYPYGEHIVYTDNQPLLAMTLGWIHRHVVDMSRHVVGTLNLLMLLSICVGVYITYFLLRRWKVGSVWALVASLCIIFLSPQLWRIPSHYGMSYAWFFPLLLLLLDYLNHADTKKWRWAIGIAVLVVVMSLSHMYFLLLSSVTVVSYALWWAWLNRRDRLKLRSILPWLLGSVIIPGLLITSWMKLTDPVQDRPTDPYGVDVYTLSPATTFLNAIPPFDQTWSKLLKTPIPDNEQRGYVGVVCALMLPAILGMLLKKKDKPDTHTIHLTALAGASLIIWCLGAGIFYKIGLAWVWEAIPVIKQFRGLGRFGFPFYYIYTLLSAVLLWQFFTALQKKELARTGAYVLCAAGLLWISEAWLNIKALSEVGASRNIYLFHKADNYVPILRNAGYEPSDFQAILHLPLVCVGNENLEVHYGFWSLREGIHVATETGLPLISYAMSRTSIAQGLDLLEFIGKPYRPKKRATLFNEKPILLTTEDPILTENEKIWTEKAQKIGQYKNISVYVLPVSAFHEVETPELPLERDDRICQFENFESMPCDTVMAGSGALAITENDQLIWRFTDTLNVPMAWELSFWSYVDRYKASVTMPNIREYTHAGELVNTTYYHRNQLFWTESYNNWLLVALPFQTSGQGHTYELRSSNKGSVVDNLLLRPAHDTCAIPLSDMMLYNNIPVPLQQ